MIRKPKIRRRNYLAIRVNGKYVLEHRLVMENHLGRPLTSTEAVHHINHDTTDNRIENLELCATHGQHTKQHHADLFNKQSLLFRGKHFSPSTEWKVRDKRLLGNKFREGKPSWNRGRPWTKEEKFKLSKAHKGKHKANSGSFTKGFVPWNKGKKTSEETKQKQKEAYRKRITPPTLG